MKEQTSDSYRMDKSGMFRGVQQVANFRAKIEQEVEVCDGQNVLKRLLVLKAKTMDQRSIEFAIDANDFNRPDWVTRKIGVTGVKWEKPFNYVVEAIRYLSKDALRVRRYSSLGFNIIEGLPAYFHGSGYLVANDNRDLFNIEVSPHQMFKGYGFPDRSTDEHDRSYYFKAALKVLDLSKSNPGIGVLILASAVRSVLCNFHPNTVTPIILGETGAGKSDAMALATSFFRPDTNTNNLPFSMTSTAKGLSLAAQESTHTLLPIDDYYPSVNKRDDVDDFIEKLIFQGSTTAPRLSGKSSTELAIEKPLNTLAIITGEVALVTDKQSRHERALYCELGREDVDQDIREQCLEHALEGDFARAMREFVVTCLEEYDLFKQKVPKRFKAIQRLAKRRLGNVHRRRWDNAADMMLGIRFFLRLCLNENVITPEEYDRLGSKSWKAILDLLQKQDTLVEKYATEKAVGRALAQLFRNGMYHLTQLGNKQKPEGVSLERVGWAKGKRRGDWLGYVDSSQRVIVVPTNIDTQQLCNSLPQSIKRLLDPGPKRFWKLLGEHGLLTTREDGRNATKVAGLSADCRYYILSIPGIFE